MYQTYYPIGTSGHRVSASVGFAPYHNYATPLYQNTNGYLQPMALPPAPPQYMQPPMFVGKQYAPPANGCAPNADARAASGGISAVLEYEPSEMAAFLCWCAFGMLGQNRSPTRQFESSIVSILNATRLPKSTVVIGLEYINQRFAAGSTPDKSMTEQEIFQSVVVALVLANKFNDDNTFTNKSWCGASGVELSLLNVLERAWLEAVAWDLNVVKFTQNIETLEECWASWCQKQASPSLAHSTSGNYYGYAPSEPSSPAYNSASSSSAYAAGYSSPIGSSPMGFAQDWSVPAQTFQPQHRAHASQSIWAYPQANFYQTMPPHLDTTYHGFANPYYNCLATY